MAASTGIILTAGGLSALDVILSGYDSKDMLRVAVATTAAALIAGGLDKALPGLGTGSAVLLLLAVLYRSGPSLSAKIRFSTS